MEPTNAEVYKNRAIAYAGAGKYDLSLQDCTHAIQLAPDDFEIYNIRGVLYSALGNDNLAVEDFSRTLELKSEYATAYYNRAIAQQIWANIKKQLTIIVRLYYFSQIMLRHIRVAG